MHANSGGVSEILGRDLDGPEKRHLSVMAAVRKAQS
jgi:hypothetical protein